jgi:uncharacterized protein
MDNIIKQAYKYSKNIFKQSAGSHDWDHVERVYNLAVHIAKKEKANMSVVQLAALLHDIGRAEDIVSGGKVDHALVGAKMAADYLTKKGVSLEIIESVMHCIKAHRSQTGVTPQSLEAKILFDADKLDCIGAIGIGRTFVFAGEIGARVHNPEINLEKTKPYTVEDTGYREYLIKLQYIHKKIFTTEGKRIAKQRHKFMVDFFARINREVAGEL